MESLRSLAERVASHRGACKIANLCADQFESYELKIRCQLMQRLQQRGVGQTFLVQLTQWLLDSRATYLGWTHLALPDFAAHQIQ